VNRPPSDLALLRYQAISAYLSLRPPRGQRTALLRQLAEQTWRLPNGRQVQFAAETLRAWVRRFRRGGIEALEDKPRPRPGVQILDPEHIDILCRLKRDVPARSIDRVIRIARSTEVIPSTVSLSRSTVHRVLQAHGLSKRKQGAASTDDLDRFEAAFANDLWQSDMLMGPWLPDPDKPGKKRRAWLHAFIDDHSRLLLAGRWDFKSDLPVLELAFKEALRRFGTPKRVYYDYVAGNIIVVLWPLRLCGRGSAGPPVTATGERDSPHNGATAKTSFRTQRKEDQHGHRSSPSHVGSTSLLVARLIDRGLRRVAGDPPLRPEHHHPKDSPPRSIRGLRSRAGGRGGRRARRAC